MNERRTLAALGAGFALLVAGCGSSDNGSSSATTAPGTGTTAGSTSDGGYGGGYGRASATTSSASSGEQVKLKADEHGRLSFAPRSLKARSGSVTLVMSDPQSSGKPHGIAVEGHGVDKDGPTVQPGGTSRLSVTLEPGTYTFYCPIPAHKQAGMVGRLVVR